MPIRPVNGYRKVSAALAPAYEELWASLPSEPRLNVDETGHKNNGQRYWTWCFRAKLYTLFKIDHSRSSNVLIDALGEEFNGVLGCDYFSAYCNQQSGIPSNCGNVSDETGSRALQ